jgi:hypothetical protein
MSNQTAVDLVGNQRLIRVPVFENRIRWVADIGVARLPVWIRLA